MNICARCRHYVSSGEGGADNWYEFLCGHPSVRHVKTVDHITGLTVYKPRNGLQTYSSNPMPYARDINKDGKCDKYEKR